MTDSTVSWFPQAWRPEPGQTIAGAVQRIGVSDGGWGPYPVVTVHTTRHEGAHAAGRDVAIHAFHEVLRHELAARQVQPGDVIEVTYLGKHEKGYHGYRVDGGAQAAFNWAQFDGEPALQTRPNPTPAEPAVGFAASEPPGDDDDLPF